MFCSEFPAIHKRWTARKLHLFPLCYPLPRLPFSPHFFFFLIIKALWLCSDPPALHKRWGARRLFHLSPLYPLAHLSFPSTFFFFFSFKSNDSVYSPPRLYYTEGEKEEIFTSRIFYSAFTSFTLLLHLNEDVFPLVVHSFLPSSLLYLIEASFISSQSPLKRLF